MQGEPCQWPFASQGHPASQAVRSETFKVQIEDGFYCFIDDFVIVLTKLISLAGCLLPQENLVFF